MTAIIIGVIVILLGAAFWFWNQRPVDRTPEEVSRLLQSRLDEEFDDGEWDYFSNCRIKDKRLERIRRSVEEIDVIGSPYLQAGSASLFALSELGRKRFEELIQECKNLST